MVRNLYNTRWYIAYLPRYIFSRIEVAMKNLKRMIKNPTSPFPKNWPYQDSNSSPLSPPWKHQTYQDHPEIDAQVYLPKVYTPDPHNMNINMATTASKARPSAVVLAALLIPTGTVLGTVMPLKIGYPDVEAVARLPGLIGLEVENPWPTLFFGAFLDAERIVPSTVATSLLLLLLLLPVYGPVVSQYMEGEAVIFAVVRFTQGLKKAKLDAIDDCEVEVGITNELEGVGESLIVVEVGVNEGFGTVAEDNATLVCGRTSAA